MFWLFKTDPETYSWDDLVKDGKTIWDGVRNFQARNYLEKVAPGDLILIYHSQSDKAVVGIAKAVSSAFPDPTTESSNWVAVEIVPVVALPQQVTLQAIKSNSELANLPLIRQSRLSIMPIEDSAFYRICEMGGVDVKSFIRK